MVQNYQRTPALRDALELMIAAYEKLGMQELENDTRRVLALNENNGSLIADPLELEDKPILLDTWEFLGLDEN